MTRYAPSLFIGLGGSGTKIVRWLKKVMRASASAFDTEPLAFRAFDLDRAANGAVLGGVESLGNGEFHPFRPQEISDCIRALYTQDSGHDAIRRWYPDLGGEHIAFAQADAAGAGQWRPLGRVGYFLNRTAIGSALSSACTDLDASIAAANADAAHVWIISSLGGGTGSGMLLDVATAVRRLRPDFFVRGYLLMPELFENIAYKANVIPNTYAALKEIAAFTTQQQLFMPYYSATEQITARDAVQPFHEVLLVGPYHGRRQPFRTPDEAYQYLSHTIEVASIGEARSSGRSDAANSRSGAAAAKSDPASTHIFGTLSGRGLPLLTYAQLADFVIMTIAREVQIPDGDREHPLLDLLRPTGPDAVDRAMQSLKGLVGAKNKPIDAPAFEKLLREWYAGWSAKKKWNQKTLEEFIATFQQACRLDTDPMGSDSILGARVKEARQACRKALLTVSDELHPYLRRRWTDWFRKRFPAPHARHPSGRKPPDVKEFVAHSQGRRPEKWFRAKLLPGSIEKLLTQTVAYFDALNAEEKQLVYDAAVANAIHEELLALADEEGKDWDVVGPFGRDLLIVVKDPWTERRSSIRFDASVRVQGAATIIARECQRYDRPESVVTAVAEGVLGAFRRAYLDYKSDPARSKTTIAKMRESIAKHLTSTLGTNPVTGDSLPFVPMTSMLDAGDLQALVLACDTPLFRPGQWGSDPRRHARIVMPHALVDYERTHLSRSGAVASTLRDDIAALCVTELHAFVADTVTADGADSSISVLLEDLSHPAQQLEGIYRYDNAYEMQPNKDLFHIARGLAAALDPIVSTAAMMTRLSCGNRRCTADLRAVPRRAVFCPGCGEPIRTRCGNDGCKDDEISSHRSTVGGKPPRECPSCHQFLRTYWWRCDRDGDVPIDKLACPHCVRSGLPEREIRRRESSELFDCPNCVRAGKTKARRFTGDVVPFIRHGANGFDTQHAADLLKANLECGALCPTCFTSLAPMCPYGATGAERHLVYRRNSRDRFICPHGHGPILTCGHCEFPVTADEPECRRCHSTLINCRFCTNAFAIRTRLEHERCGWCGLEAQPPSWLAPSVIDAADGTRVCTDIYGCRAGAVLTQATYDRGVQSCFHCRSARLPLMDAAMRKPLIAACAFCADLLGVDAKADQADRFTLCPLCGQRRSTVAELCSTQSEKTLAVAIGRALLAFPDDNPAAFRRIIRDTGSMPVNLDGHLLRYHQRVTHTAVRESLEKRVEALIGAWRQISARDAEAEQAEATHTASLQTRVAEPQPVSEDLLAPSVILALATETEIDEWIAVVRFRYQREDVDDAIARAHGVSFAHSTTLELLTKKWRDAIPQSP